MLEKFDFKRFKPSNIHKIQTKTTNIHILFDSCATLQEAVVVYGFLLRPGTIRRPPPQRLLAHPPTSPRGVANQHGAGGGRFLFAFHARLIALVDAFGEAPRGEAARKLGAVQSNVRYCSEGRRIFGGSGEAVAQADVAAC